MADVTSYEEFEQLRRKRLNEKRNSARIVKDAKKGTVLEFSGKKTAIPNKNSSQRSYSDSRNRMPQEMQNKTKLAAARYQDTEKGSTFKETAKTAEKVIRGPKWKAPVEAIKLASYFRKKVDNHENSPYFIVLLVAIAIDIADASWIIGFVCKPFLFWFLWGKGTWKIKWTLRILLFFDCIPFVSWLLLSTISVVVAWRHSSKEAKKAKENLEALGEIAKTESEMQEDYAEGM
jgi:hypothetical protein